MSRVLLVDDDAAALDLRKLILEREGYEVCTAGDPVLARLQFAEMQPECVILDLRLPEADDGLALIREFRGAAPASHIIVLCGWLPDLEGTPEEPLVNTVLGKPIRTADLVSALRKACSPG